MAARVDTSRVPATARPPSSTTSQPVDADRVWSSTHHPKFATPSPCTHERQGDSATTMAHTLAAKPAPALRGRDGETVAGRELNFGRPTGLRPDGTAGASAA